MNKLLLLPVPLLLLAATACWSKSSPGAEPSHQSADSAAPVHAQRASDLPRLRGRVVDDANLLSAAAEARLTRALADLQARTSDQLVVVTIPDLRGEAIDALGMRLGNGWRIGQAKLDNGILLIVAPADRKVRIEVGRGLEGLATDERAAAIIEETIIPSFKSDDFETGIESGARDIIKLLESDARRPQRRGARQAA